MNQLNIGNHMRIYLCTSRRLFSLNNLNKTVGQRENVRITEKERDRIEFVFIHILVNDLSFFLIKSTPQKGHASTFRMSINVFCISQSTPKQKKKIYWFQFLSPISFKHQSPKKTVFRDSPENNNNYRRESEGMQNVGRG